MLINSFSTVNNKQNKLIKTILSSYAHIVVYTKIPSVTTCSKPARNSILDDVHLRQHWSRTSKIYANAVLVVSGANY